MNPQALVPAEAFIHHNHHGRGVLLILGICLIVIGCAVGIFRNTLARRNQAVQQARYDTAPRLLKPLTPHPGPGYYRVAGPTTAILFIVVGIVLVLLS